LGSTVLTEKSSFGFSHLKKVYNFFEEQSYKVYKLIGFKKK